jgi:hypothetical protein
MLLSRREMAQRICTNHYTHSLPSSGDTVFCQCDSAIVLFSQPASPFISNWLLGENNAVWELSRLWAPDGHDSNLLTRAISSAIAQLLAMLRRTQTPLPHALISYADPSFNHSGGIYRAASWIYLGQSKETRFYRNPDTGQMSPRRAWHTGSRTWTVDEIAAAGFIECRGQGKHRFAKGLTKQARRKINHHPERQ